MSKSKFPFMPLYWDDYLHDTAHLTTLEHGAYLLLICNYWSRSESLPNDDKKLSRIVHLTLDEWLDIRPIIAEFFTVETGVWKHKRCDSELAKATAISNKNKLNAHKRWSGKVVDFKR